MTSFNKVVLVGYLGADPEVRLTGEGKQVCNFAVATTENKKDKNGEVQQLTTWFRVTCWGRQAELAEIYLSKGSQIYIEGKIRVNEYSDRDGKQRSTLEVIASDLRFIGARTITEQEAALKAQAPSRKPACKAEVARALSDDDVPF